MAWGVRVPGSGSLLASSSGPSLRGRGEGAWEQGVGRGRLAAWRYSVWIRTPRKRGALPQSGALLLSVFNDYVPSGIGIYMRRALQRSFMAFKDQLAPIIIVLWICTLHYNSANGMHDKLVQCMIMQF